MYGIIVGRGGVSPAYFFDRMTFPEASAFIDGWHEERKDRWEQVRRIIHSVYQVNSRTELDLEDVLKFPWDEEDGSGQGKAPTDEELERLRKEAVRMEKMMK